ncbi:hypothetical protein REPUB_Repub10bG0026000 [Reevesia pubescens]
MAASLSILILHIAFSIRFCHADPRLDIVACSCESSNLLPGCFPASGGCVYLDGCFIRANNYSFYREIIAAGDMKIASNSPNNRGFGLAHETKNGTRLYSMAQCWRILDKDACSACLIDAVYSAFNCIPSVDGRADDVPSMLAVFYVTPLINLPMILILVQSDVSSHDPGSFY